MLTEAAFKATRLCVVGNINRDIKTAPLDVDERLLKDGETPAQSIVETIGGGGANSACTAAVLGAQVAFFGKVGADSLGKQLEQTLTQHGVVARLVHDASLMTGSSIALTYRNGRRHFLSCQPNNESLILKDLDLAAMAHFDHLLRADIWFSKSMLFGGNEQLFRAARDKGLKVSIDLNWDPLWGIASPDTVQSRKQAIRSVLRWVNMAHGNVRELCAFADTTQLETALTRLAEWGVETVVIHMGTSGAGCYQQGKLWIEPAVPARQHLNATGTGDVLSVCMILLDHHQDVPAKLRLANAIVAQFIAGDRQFIPALH